MKFVGCLVFSLLQAFFLFQHSQSYVCDIKKVTAYQNLSSGLTIIVAKNATVQFNINNGEDVVTATGNFPNTSEPPNVAINGQIAVTFGSAALGNSSPCTITISSADAYGNPCQSPAKTFTFNVIVPKITLAGTQSGLTWYASHNLETSDQGGPESFITLKVLPDPTNTGIDYNWSLQNCNSLWYKSGTNDGAAGSPVILQSTAAGASPGDQDVQLLGPANSVVADKTLSVTEPTPMIYDKALNNGNPTDQGLPEQQPTAPFVGWETTFTLQLQGPFQLPVYQGTTVFETFDQPGTTDYSGKVSSNWASQQANASWATWTTNQYGDITDSSGQSGDTYSVGPWGFWSPQPVWPNATGAGTLIFHVTQHYHSCSKSDDMQFETLTAQFYLGHGRQK